MRDGIPIEYTLQVSLYGYLLGVENVMIIVSFLEEKDYQHPEEFRPTEENTMIYHFNIYEKHPDFQDLLQQAKRWWEQYIPTGISPTYGEKDQELIQELKNRCFIDPDTTLEDLLKPYEDVLLQLEQIEKSDLYQQYQQLQEEKNHWNQMLKKYFLQYPEKNKTQYQFDGDQYQYEGKFVEMTTLDKDRLQQDGLLEKYTKRVSTLFKVRPKRKAIE